MAAAGRARIEQQKQAELANIQKKKEAALNALNIQYATADKAKTSFGFTGVIFLTVLFGSILGNDLLKVCSYCCNGLGRWWRKKKENDMNKKVENDVKKTDEIIVDLKDQDDLDETLEKVYFKLVKINAINRRDNNQTF